MGRKLQYQWNTIVWQAFREYGIDQNIYAVAGTLVVALNAALWLQGDLNKAKEIWLNLTL
jgi:NTE family protein